MMKKSKTFKILSILLCVSLLLQQTGFAQVANAELNIAGTLNSLHNALSPDKFRPLHLRSISYDSLNNNFKLLLDKGDQFKDKRTPGLESTTKDLLNYFFTGIALPNGTFWVNLRPDLPDDIIDPLLAQTQIGKILLEADLQLKKDTADATNPSTPQGKEYWDKLYTRAQELYGTQNVTIPTLTRPWIVPDEIIIRESVDSAYIYKATLKVMLEQDYLKDNVVYSFKDVRERQLNAYSAQIIREDIIPRLTKEINNAKRYAPLRQVYYSLILAQWFKARHRGLSPTTQGGRAGLNLPYPTIDSKDLTNLKIQIPYSVATYFNAYKENFAKGQYNIQEPISTPFGQSIRSYFSGGFAIGQVIPAFGQATSVNPAGTITTIAPTVGDPSVSNSDLAEVNVRGSEIDVVAGVGESAPSVAAAEAKGIEPSPNLENIPQPGPTKQAQSLLQKFQAGISNAVKSIKKNASSSQNPLSSIPVFDAVKKQYDKVAQTYAILPKDYHFTVSDPTVLRDEQEFQKFLGLVNERYGILDPGADANSKQYAFLSDTITKITTRLNDRAGHKQLRTDIKVYISLEPVVNAYCLPDGSVVITQKLLDGLDFSDEIAAVLAHELSHYQDNYLTWNNVGTPLDKRLGEYKADAVSPSLINGIGFNQLAVIYLSNKLESFVKGSSDWTHGSQFDRTTLLRMNLQGQDLTHVNAFHPLEGYWKSPEGYFIVLDYLTYLKQSSFQDFKDTWGELTQKTLSSQEQYKFIIEEFIGTQQRQPFNAASYYLSWQKLVYISQYLLKENTACADGLPAESTDEVVRYLALSLLSSRNDNPDGYDMAPYLGDYFMRLLNIQTESPNVQEWQEVYNFFTFDGSLLSLDGFGKRITAITLAFNASGKISNPAFGGSRIWLSDYLRQLRQYYFSVFYSNLINSFDSEKDFETYRIFLEQYISSKKYVEKNILDPSFVYYPKRANEDIRKQRLVGSENPHQWYFVGSLWHDIFNEEAALRKDFDSYEQFSSRLSEAQKKKLGQLVTFTAEWIRNTQDLQEAKDYSNRQPNDTELGEEIHNRFGRMTYVDLTLWLSSSLFDIFSSVNPLSYGLRMEATNRVLQQAKLPEYGKQIGLYEYMAQGDRVGFLRMYIQKFTANHFQDKDGRLWLPISVEGISRMSTDRAQAQAYAVFYREAMEQFLVSSEFIAYQKASLSEAFFIESAIRRDILCVESKSREESKVNEEDYEVILRQMDQKYYLLWEQNPQREELAAIAQSVSGQAKKKRLEYTTVRKARQFIYADAVNDNSLANAALTDFDAEAAQATLINKLSLLSIQQLQALTDSIHASFALSNAEISARKIKNQGSISAIGGRSRFLGQEVLINYYGKDSDELNFLHPVIEAKLVSLQLYAASLSVSSWKDLEEAYYFIERYSPPGRQKRELLTNLRHRIIKEGKFSDAYTFVSNELGYGNFDALYYFRQERVDTDAEYQQYQQLVSVYEKGNSLDGKVMLGGFMALDKTLEEMKIGEKQAMDFMKAMVTGDDDYLASVIMETITKIRAEAQQRDDVDVSAITDVQRVDDWMNRFYSMTQLERFVFFQRLLSKYNAVFFRAENLEKLSAWILGNVSGMKPEELQLMQNILVAFLANVDNSELTLFLSKVLAEHALVGDPAYTHRAAVMSWFTQPADPFVRDSRLQRWLPAYERFQNEIYRPTQNLLSLEELQKSYGRSSYDRKRWKEHGYDRQLKEHKQYQKYKKYVTQEYGKTAEQFFAFLKDNPSYIPDTEIEAVYAVFNPGESMINPQLLKFQAKEREYYRQENAVFQFKTTVGKTKALSIRLGKFIATAGQAIGALGVRFLQVFGQYYAIPQEYKEEFSNVYDNASTLVKSNLFQSLAVEIERMQTVRDGAWIKSAAYAEWSKRLMEAGQTIPLTEYLKQFRAEAINFLGFRFNLNDSPLQDYDQRVFLSLFAQNLRDKKLTEYNERTASMFEEVFTETLASFKAFYTAQVEAMEYLKIHLRIEKVLGGGSINTAYLVSVTQPDGSVARQVVKIISPNLEVLLGERAEQMQKTVKDLIAKDPKNERQYIMAERLLGTLRLWVKDDINDGFFLSDDAIFSSAVFYPAAGSITTSRVLQPYGYRIKVEEYAPGDTLKKILNGGDQVVPAQTDKKGRVSDSKLKAALADFARDYLTHLLTPVADSYSGETIYMAHSDFHIGNLMLNKRPDGSYEKIVIDRNYYLKLLPVDIDLITRLSMAWKFNFMGKVDALINYLLQVNPDKTDQDKVRQEIRSVILKKIFSWSTVIDLIQGKDVSSSVANLLMAEFEKRGYDTPLRIRLFFKNVSAINNLLQYVDGSDLFDAIKKYISTTNKGQVLKVAQVTPAPQLATSTSRAATGSKSVVIGSGPAQFFYDRFGQIDLGKMVVEWAQSIRWPWNKARATIQLQPSIDLVDLNRFIWAQYRLAERNIPRELLPDILKLLKLNTALTGEAAYKAIYEGFGSNGYAKEVVDLIIGDTYPVEGVRLDVEIVDQNKNARIQSICEAVSNGLDAHGFRIGQFSKGVKQIIDWLGPSAEDKIEIFTRKENSKAYHLTLTRDAQGARYIQIKEISAQEYQDLAQEYAGQIIEHGTIVKVSTVEAIPRLDSQRDETHRNSQGAIADAIHQRFPFVGEVDIYTQMSGQREPVKINGFENKRVVVPVRSKAHAPEESQGRFVKVITSEHAITIVDNGSGMDAEVLAKMFVPKEGTKRPASLELNIDRELGKVKVVHDEALPHRVSFARNGEVIIAVDIPGEIMDSATVTGGLMLELGGLLDVSESRDNIIMGLNLGGKIPSFQQGVEYAIKQIVKHPKLTTREKIKYINTIMVGLDGLINSNANSSHLVKGIRANVQEVISGLIQELRHQGVIVLPQQKEFGKLELGGKDVLFVHGKLFDWQLSSFLNAIGGEIIPYVTLGGASHLPLIIAPFTQEATKRFFKFDRLWHTWAKEERLPVIKTESFVIIPQELGRRLLELSRKRSGGLTAQEEKEYSSLLQRVNIITAEEVVTSYEHAKPKDNLAVTAIPEVKEVSGAIDSGAINKFLREPPVMSMQKGVKEAGAQAKEPADLDLVKVVSGIAQALPDDYSRCRAYAVLARGLAKTGRIDEAKEALNKAHHFYRVEKDASDRNADGCDALIATALAEAEIGQEDLAFVTLRKAYLEAQNVFENDNRSRSWLMVRAVKAFVMVMDKSAGVIMGTTERLGLFEEVIDFTGHIPDPSAKARAIASITEALAGAARLQGSAGTYALFAKLVNMIKGMSHNDLRENISTIIEALIASDITIQEVFTLLKEIKGTVEKLDNKERILAIIAKAFSRLERQREAGKLFEDILINVEKFPNSWSKGTELLDITNALVESKLPEEEVYALLQRAQRIAEKLTDPEDKAEALAIVAAAYFKMIRIADAENVFKKALSITIKISDVTRKGQVFDSILKSFVGTDKFLVRPEKLQEIFDIVIKQLDLGSVLERLLFLSHEVKGLIENGDIKEAGRLCNSILEVLGQFNTDSVVRKSIYPGLLFNIAQGLAQIGEVDESLKITRKIPEDEVRMKCEALVSVAEAFAKGNRIAEAKAILKEILELINNNNVLVLENYYAAIEVLAEVEKVESTEAEPLAHPQVQPAALFSETKPADAPNSIIITPQPGGGFSLINREDKNRAAPFAYVRVQRIGSTDAFIVYESNDSFYIYKGDQQLFDGRPIIGTTYSVVAIKGNLVVIEKIDMLPLGTPNKKHYIVLDTASGVEQSESSEVFLSASGRFSVHKQGNNILTYSDYNTAPNRVPQIITHDSLGFRVDDKADVVILQDKQGKYSLFSLGQGRFLIQGADHIEIDSSGEVAIFKAGNKLDYLWLNEKEEKKDEMFISMRAKHRDLEEGGKIRVTSDGGKTYLLIVNKDGRLKECDVFSRASGYAAPGIFIHRNIFKVIEAGPSTDPISRRYWEEYDLEKKTIWDEETNGIPESYKTHWGEVMASIGFEYNRGTPIEPLGSILLQGNNLIFRNFSHYEGSFYLPTGDHDVCILNLDSGLLTDIKQIQPSDRVVSLEGGKVWYLLNAERGFEVVYAITDKSRPVASLFFEHQFFIEQNNNFILVATHDGRILLVNNFGEIKGVTKQVPQNFICADVNGEYFVFVNPQTQEIRYLDPRKVFVQAPQPAQVQAQAEEAQINAQEVMAKWRDNVFSQRDAFIARAQAAYQPFLDLIPEEFKHRSDFSLGEMIKELYLDQEDEINRRFRQALENNQPLNLEELPFDIFSRRMQQFLRVLPGFLQERKTQLSQERIEDQYDFYFDLFFSLICISKERELNIEHLEIDNQLFEALAYGWGTYQEKIDILPVIIKFIAALKEATPGEVKRLTSIINFLSGVSLQAANHADGAHILANQINRLLALKPEARDKYLSDLYSAFELFDDANERRSFQLKDAHKLGKARPFVVFLTNNVEQLREKERTEPEGVDEFNARGPEEAVALSQIIKLEQQRPKNGLADKVMSVEQLVRSIFNLPQSSAKLESDILLNATVQRESGAYTAEIAQNSRDATRGKHGELLVDFYLQQNSQGQEEYVEEARDNGTGALEEVALLIPKSTKAAAGQIELTGFFGTGKYTLFEGVDRLEIITKNSQRAYMFVFAVIRDSSGRPTAVKLTRIRKITDPKVAQGVTVRRIKSLDNTIPELDQMLSQRSWKIFVGLAQDEHFKVFFIDHEGKKQQLAVEKDILAEVEFKAVRPQEKDETNFGPLRIISAKDMPLQIVDKAGLRVSEMKEEYLALIPSVLRRHIQELGIIIQIPLPLIRNRSAFEHENEFLPQIQRYVAVAFFQAIAYKALSQSSPQFVFEGFPLDWETNDSYWQSINPASDRWILGVANDINVGRIERISEEALRGLLTEPGKLDKEKKFTKLILLLEVFSNRQNSDSKVSLLTRRLAIQEETNKAILGAAKLQRELLMSGGFNLGRLPSLSDIPFSGNKVMQALGIALGHDQMQRPERYILNPNDYNDNERELVTLAWGIARNFGIEQIILLNDEVRFAGAFKIYQGKHTMFLARSIASEIGRAATNSTAIDSATDTIVHELGHLLEEFMRQDNAGRFWQEGYIAHLSDFTHDAVGTFAEAMKYAAAVSLNNGDGSVSLEMDSGETEPSPSSLNPTSPDTGINLASGTMPNGLNNTISQGDGSVEIQVYINNGEIYYEVRKNKELVKTIRGDDPKKAFKEAKQVAAEALAGSNEATEPSHITSEERDKTLRRYADTQRSIDKDDEENLGLPNGLELIISGESPEIIRFKEEIFSMLAEVGFDRNNPEHLEILSQEYAKTLKEYIEGMRQGVRTAKYFGLDAKTSFSPDEIKDAWRDITKLIVDKIKMKMKAEALRKVFPRASKEIFREWDSYGDMLGKLLIDDTQEGIFAFYEKAGRPPVPIAWAMISKDVEGRVTRVLSALDINRSQKGYKSLKASILADLKEYLENEIAKPKTTGPINGSTSSSSNSAFAPGGIDSSTTLTIDSRQGEKLGGIDFRFLPIVIQSIDSLKAGIRSLPQSTLQGINLTQEWSDIERLVNSGITPSAERLKEYLAASCFKGSLDQDTNRIVSCIADILRMEEESCCLTDPTLKDILVVLGSGRSGEELRIAFNK
ncbi:MAG: M48 family metalloprotease [Candidatus Omnitrophica bacterium]|nr:M48 family metalloprotease [Candidatus Omnitrophota bacterium]